MIKKITALSTVLFFAFTLLLPSESLFAASTLPISAPSALLIDANTNRIIYSKTPHLKRAPASTTKILTSLVAYEHNNLNKRVTIPSFVTSIQPSKAYLRPGEVYTIRDLIRATLISSSNDAAEVLAVATSGSKANFAALMNKKVRSLGGRHSNFVNASGLPANNQYSTAYDLALIMKEVQRHEFLVQTMKIKTYSIQSTRGRRIFLRNHNKMLWRDSRDVIGKTGWTRLARHCFVGQIGLGSQRVFVSMMGSHRLWIDLKQLVDFCSGKSINRVRTNRNLLATHEVKRVQRALKKAGYNPGFADGKFGSKTLRAVEKFQKAKGLHVDGIVGQDTMSALRKYM